MSKRPFFWIKKMSYGILTASRFFFLLGFRFIYRKIILYLKQLIKILMVWNTQHGWQAVISKMPNILSCLYEDKRNLWQHPSEETDFPKHLILSMCMYFNMKCGSLICLWGPLLRNILPWAAKWKQKIRALTYVRAVWEKKKKKKRICPITHSWLDNVQLI